jgi:hypothetical protein
MYLGRLVAAPPDTVIHGRAVARSHSVLHDASPEDIERRPWKKQWSRQIRVHHPEFLAGTLANGVSLQQLMDELEADAFASTLRNMLLGKGNTNPRRAFQQKPAVKLSPVGSAWMKDKLEAAFARHGILESSSLQELDWPTIQF